MKIRRKIIIIIVSVISLLVAFLFVVIFVLLTSSDRSVIFSGLKQFNYDGNSRYYRVVEPTKNTSKILIGLHGFGDSSRQFAYYTGLHNVVDHNTLVVYPEAIQPDEQGIKKGWNAGFCCGSGYKKGVDDVGYIKSLIEQLKKDYEAEDAKVYLSGFSNGAFMAQRIAAEQPELIDKIGVSSGSIGTTENRLVPSGPVPVLLLHGKKDTTVPFDGGVGSSDPDFNWLSYNETADTWRSVNNSQAEVKTITYPNDGHKWHDWRILNIWNKKPQASQEIITFFN